MSLNNNCSTDPWSNGLNCVIRGLIHLIRDQYYYWPKAHATGLGRVLIWDQEFTMIKGRASTSRSNCIPLYVSYDGKPSDRAFAGLLVFSGQE